MKVMIVEDNQSQLNSLIKMVSEIPEAEISGYRTAEDAVAQLKKATFDLFLLDVQLPGKNGFFLASQIRSMQQYHLTPILFITGNERDSLQAFKQYHCYDYIIKPVLRRELREKIDMILSSLKHQAEKGLEKLVAISTDDGDLFVRQKELLFIEVKGKNCFIHMKEKVYESKGVSLSAVIADLEEAGIVRCHRSFAINPENISKIININYRLWEAHFKESEETVAVSKKYYDTLLLKLGKELT